MINKVKDDTRLSRSVSQNDHTDQVVTSVYLGNQSSCSSLTSGIGQSDQSICNERSAVDPEQNEQQSQNEIHDTSLGNQSQMTHIKSSEVPGVSESHPDSQKIAQPNPFCNSKDSIIRGYNENAYDEKLKLDIKEFVDIIFTDSQSISLERKAKFGRMMQKHEARMMFAVSVDDYRVNSKRVSELTFYSLAQYFSIVLLECLLAEDFRPAKIIMNMMFTYYYEQNYDKIPPRDRPQTTYTNSELVDSDSESKDQPKIIKTYLYTQLKEQEIFKSIRFWTSAFYESVIIERNNHPVFVDKQRGKSNEKRDEEMDCSKNITFGLLGSFIHNMCLLELSHEFCQEFLDKHSTIAGLSDEQLDMLRSNLKSMFNDSGNGEKFTLSQVTAGERLSMFLHKWSNRLNQASTS